MITRSAMRDASKRSQLGSIPDGYTVKASKFLNRKKIKSKGLYTDRNLPKDYVIGEYIGVLLTDEEAKNKRKNRNYMFDVRPPCSGDDSKEVAFVIDCANKRLSSFVRYANTADFEHQQNSQFVQVGLKIFLVTLKPLRRNTEILAWYGWNTENVVSSK